MNAATRKKQALVTGGTRGIGRAIAERLLQEDIEVTITGRSPDWTENDSFTYCSVDFADPKQLNSFANSLHAADFDILVNNAGINKIGNFDEIDPADFDRIQQVNVKAPFLISQAVLKNMRKKNYGRIVNITSIFGVVSKEFRAPYSTSKFGLDGMTSALAAEVAEFGILANCVSPGFIDTDLTRQVLGEDGIRELTERVPIKRLGKPEEIAALVAWLVSDENSYMSGQNIVIDGGFTRV